MDRFIIHGGVPLEGTVHISGAKNAALPCLAACLLTAEPVTLDNLPAVRDIATTCHLLRGLGVSLDEEDSPKSSPGVAKIPAPRRIVAQAHRITNAEAPWELVRTCGLPR